MTRMASGLPGVVAACLLLSACQTIPGDTDDFETARMALDGHIRTLSDDSFAGREPGTPGGRKTQQYLIDTLQSFGYTPGAADAGWRQPVSLVRYQPGSADLDIVANGHVLTFRDGEAVVSGAPRALDTVAIIAIRAGEDIEEGSLSDKAALVRAGEARALFATLSASEAEAIILQAETDAQFSEFSGFLRNGRWQLKGAEDTRPPIVLLPPRSAERLLVRNASLAMTMTSRPASQSIESANVIAKLPGRVEGSGAVLILAHWDHLGTCGSEGDTDRVCNGAIDNASGLGVMLETARRISVSGGLDRDLYVIGTTGEELGLLGAEAFVSDPPVPLPTIVAAFNIDSVAIAPRGAPTTMVGWGRTPLDEDIEFVVKSIGGTFKDEPYTEQFVRRQDGWALLSRDVPAVLVSTSFADIDAFTAFLQGPYHGAADEWRPDMELGGATDDIFTHVALLRHFGNVASYQPGARDKPAAQSGAGEQ